MVRLLHIHRRVWGKPYSKDYSRRPNWSDMVTYEERKANPEMRITYSRTYQDGVCKCGDTIRLELR